MRRGLSVLSALCLLLLPAAAQDRRGDMSGGQLRRALSGNTVTGRHDDGMPYSEFHSPDGRVFGHNNHEAVDNGCWDIRGDEVCYYYARGTIKGEFCWTFRQVTDSGLRLKSSQTGMEATGIVQAGNPYAHGDNGKPWICDPLQSRAITPRGGASRLARR
jgi:hypothetical protein